MQGTSGLVLGLIAGGALGAGGALLALWPGSDADLSPTSVPDAATVPVTKAELEALRAKAAEVEALRAEAQKPAPAAAVDEKMEAEWARYRRAVAEAEATIADLKAKLEVAEAAMAEAKPPPADPRAFRFGLSEKTPTFDQADWASLAGHMTAMTAAIPGLMDVLASGKQPDAGSLAKIQEHNMPLAAFAIQAANELAGTGPNGAYTHPAVIANLMRAALAEAKDPLTPEQEAAIHALGLAWAGEMERAVASYGATTLALRKTVDEVDAKIRFLNAARATLTATQQAILFPAATTGRVQLDLLSPGLVYIMRQPVMSGTRESLETQLLTGLTGLAGATEPEGAPHAWIARAWLDALPGALQPRGARDPDVMFPHVDAVQAAARAQLSAMEKLLALGELTDLQAKSLRDTTAVLQPQLLKNE